MECCNSSQEEFKKEESTFEKVESTADYRISHTPMLIPQSILSMLSPVSPVNRTDTLSTVLSALKSYIFQHKLYSRDNPFVINCENDQLGEVLGLSKFSLQEIKLIILRLLLRENRARREELLKIVQSTPSKRKELDDNDSHDGERKKSCLEDENNSPQCCNDSGTEQSKADCHFVSDSSADEDDVQMANILAINQMYSVEYEIESDSSISDHALETDSLSEIEDILGAAAATELVKDDSDEEFWADRSSEECCKSDIEISKSDLWECKKSYCKSLNKPTMRYCLKCWELRTGWVIQNEERKPPRTKRKPRKKRPREVIERTKKAHVSSCAQGSQQDAVAGPSTSRSVPTAQLSSSTESVERKKIDGESQKMCILCCDKSINAAIVHGKIGHNVVCYRCGRKLLSRNEPCPICRRRIERVIHITTL